MGWAAENLLMNTETKKDFDIVIVGLGKTGYAGACFFANQNTRIAVTDSRQNPPALESIQKTLPDVPLYLGKIDGELLMNAGELLVSPGVSLREPVISAAIQSGVKVYGDVEAFCQRISKPVIAITGSNGKSTVTTLITEMVNAAGLNAAMGGNIGTPVLDLLTKEQPDYYVLELSSFQLETVSSLNAVASVVLNISQDHMERYSSLADYSQIKSRIYAGDGTMVINLDDPLVANMINVDRKTIGFTLRNPDSGQYGLATCNGKQWLVKAEEKLMPVENLRIPGKHNISNALAALALADAINLPRDAALNVLEKFSGLPHRCQWIATIRGVDWYNDSKGTNVAASCAAITGLSSKENIILIAGGDSKGADFSDLVHAARGRVREAIVIGRDGHLVKSALQDHINVYTAESMESAVNKASEITTPGDLVLLSPACASTDMFVDYQARGNAFVSAVERLRG